MTVTGSASPLTVGAGAHFVSQALKYARNEPLVLEPTLSLAEAIEELEANGSWCALVAQGDYVLGTFTFRCLATAVADAHEKLNYNWLRQTSVAEYLEGRGALLQEQDDLSSAVSALESSLVVGVMNSTGGTTLLAYDDVLRFYADKTIPLFQIESVELGLRLLAEARIPAGEVAEAIERSRAGFEAAVDGTTKVADLTLSGLIGLFLNQVNYERYFTGLFNSRTAASSVLRDLNLLRNDIFHFRGAPNPQAAARLERAAKLVEIFVRREQLTPIASDDPNVTSTQGEAALE